MPIHANCRCAFRGGMTLMCAVAIAVSTLGVASPGISDDTRGQETVILGNNDRLHGRISGVVDGQHVEWFYPPYNQTIRFPTEMVKHVYLRQWTRNSQNAYAPEQTIVILTNDNSLPGTLVSIDADSVRLDTNYAGKLTIQRAFVRTIYPHPKERYAMYTGPREKDEWLTPRGAKNGWAHNDNRLHTTKLGVSALNMRLTGAIQIEFNVSWDKLPRFEFGLATEPVGHDKPVHHAIKLKVDGNRVSLQPTGNDRDRSANKSVSIQNLPSAKNARFRLGINPEEHLVTLHVNEREVAKITDIKDLLSKWEGIVFNATDNLEHEIDGIVISPWITVPPPDKAVRMKAPPDDTLVMFNGDTITGALLSIHDDTVNFRAAVSDLDIPLGRVAAILTGAKTQKTAKPGKTDITVWLDTWHFVTCAMESVSDDGFIIQNPAIGRATFGRDTLLQLDFGPKDTRKKKR